MELGLAALLAAPLGGSAPLETLWATVEDLGLVATVEDMDRPTDPRIGGYAMTIAIARGATKRFRLRVTDPAGAVASLANLQLFFFVCTAPGTTPPLVSLTSAPAAGVEIADQVLEPGVAYCTIDNALTAELGIGTYFATAWSVDTSGEPQSLFRPMKVRVYEPCGQVP